ncbi:MAG TPA: extracellular solute-binding protein [Mycobacteriales bacterium]|nr:extracellular solute-binding protein [Mycobacteriales bacterium]
MRTRSATLIAVAGLLLAGCGSAPTSGAADGPGGHAPSAGGTAYARYAALTGQARTDRLLADAKKQGGVLDIYTSNTDIQDLVDAFGKTYPSIKVNAFRANGETVLQRLAQETKANKIANDIVDTDSNELRVLAGQGVLAPYDGPAKQGLRKEAVFADWTAERFNAFVIGWNTKRVTSGREPKSFLDLAEPRWKGKVSMEVGDWDWYGAMHTYLTDVKHMSPATVDAAFTRIVANAKVTKGHTVQGELLSAGQSAVATSVYSHTVDKAAKKGAPVAWKPAVEPIIIRPNGLGLMARPRHPAAALLWTDWVLTDGQKVIAKSLRIPAETDVPGFDNPIPAGATVYNMPATVIDNSQKWNKAYDDLLRGATRTG